MRGTPLACTSLDGQIGIIPACAGNTFPRSRIGGFHRDHPRMCGEHDLMVINSLENLGSSPHVRGTPAPMFLARVSTGIIPACAGNTACSSSPRLSSWDHPRMCGEHTASRLGGVKVGSGDHPRMCGEHTVDRPTKKDRMGSSPHVRGTLHTIVLHVAPQGIIPACAGNTYAATSTGVTCGDHPRMCGEHSMYPSARVSRLGSSPHVRGTPGGARPAQFDDGIIPACAGNTSRPMGTM